jgi:formate--tetrahydrofolate ligase
VLVATVRALKMHGGVAREALAKPNPAAVEAGCANLSRHLRNLARFGVPAVVAVNRFLGDSPDELAVLSRSVVAEGAEAVVCTHWADGATGAATLAARVAALAEGGGSFRPLYPDDLGLAEKIRTIATEVYGAADIALSEGVAQQLAGFEVAGHGHLPICMAKTQYSFSADPNLKGAPVGHMLPVRAVRLSAGAGFVVALCGEIMTMPGLPKVPAAESIDVDAKGDVHGLF